MKFTKPNETDPITSHRLAITPRRQVVHDKTQKLG